MKNKIEKYQSKGKFNIDISALNPNKGNEEELEVNDKRIGLPAKTEPTINTNNGVRGLLGTTNFQVRKLNLPKLQFDETVTTQPSTQMQSPQSGYWNPTQTGGLDGYAFRDVLGGHSSQYGTGVNPEIEALRAELAALKKEDEEAAKKTTQTATPAVQTPAKKTGIGTSIKYQAPSGLNVADFQTWVKSKAGKVDNIYGAKTDAAWKQYGKDYLAFLEEKPTQYQFQNADEQKAYQQALIDKAAKSKLEAETAKKKYQSQSSVKESDKDYYDMIMQPLAAGATTLGTTAAGFVGGRALIDRLGKLQKYNPIGRLTALIPGINYKGKSNKKQIDKNLQNNDSEKGTREYEGVKYQKGGFLKNAKQVGKEALTDTAIGSVLNSKKSERDFDWIDGISLGASFVPGLNAVSAGFDAGRNLYDEYKAGDLDSKDFVREGLDFTTNLIPGAKAAKKAYKFTRAFVNPKTAKAIGGATKLIFTNEKGGQLFKDGGLVGKKFKKPLMVFQD